MQDNEAKISALVERFINGLKEISDVSYNGDGERIPSVVNVRFAGVENTAFLYNMDLNGVCLSAGSACASASVKPSHVLTAMGLDETEAKESVRFSFGKNNTEEEIDEVLALTRQTVEKIRKFRR